MGAFSIWHWLIILSVIVLIFGTRRHFRLHPDRRQDGDTPVYSAETTSNKEAEFIRDPLPKRISPIIIVLAMAAFCAIVWWLTR